MSARLPERSGRLLAAASANVQLEVADLQQLVGEEAKSLVNGRERAGASIAIQLRERLEDAVVLTHSASATVREALLHTPPANVICTVSSPQDEGREFAEELRASGLEVELVEDDEAPARLEWASLLLLGADTVFHDGTLCNKTGTRALAEAAAAQSVPVVVACEVIKLAPIDPGDAPALTAEEFELTPAVAGRLRRDRGGHRLAGRDRRPRRPNALPARGLRPLAEELLERPRRQSRHGLHVGVASERLGSCARATSCYAASTDCGASCSCGRRTLRETPSAATAPAATTAAPT